MNNTEWVTGSKESFKSKTPILKYFYQAKPNLIEINKKDFFLVINPVLQLNVSREQGNNQQLYLNTRGITVRGMISDKIGFSTTITDNQERGPRFFQHFNNKYGYRGGRDIVVPGAGFVKTFKDTTTFDYFDARGSISFKAVKHIDVQFGYDKNFIGDGYRSLFLSDWGNSYLFLKLNTKVGIFNYQNLFMELTPQFVKGPDTLLSKKYAAMHHLSVNVTKWLNVGLFEGVIFGRKDHFDFQYLNPIIFYRHIEGTVGSPDNAVAGFDYKANIAHKFQLYGQILLDEFVFSKIKENKGWWANKWAWQAGVKYIDAFGIKNLDLQFESNRVRPFTYSHSNAVANYTHYNQPLAHPLGANFQEFIALGYYQPAPKWRINAKIIYYKQGLDSLNGANYGSDPSRSNMSTADGSRNGRNMENGYTNGAGRKATCLNGLFLISYEARENMFIDLSLQQRNYKIDNDATGTFNTTLITAGIRWNIRKREYDF
ncbi:MAG: hypothetical protein HY305_02640 [Sphingobacteriales bacterium]|nr:hypothetical protein [Sphingobacteriales bacterium]